MGGAWFASIEPLSAKGRALEGEGRMGGDEQGTGQGLGPDRGKVNQVKAIRADAMQQQHERIRLATRSGAILRAFQCRHE
jgi:hypothetical protein